MMDAERLKHPAPHFNIFVPNDTKLKDLHDKLMNRYLYVSDEGRNTPAINATMCRIFSDPAALYYEIGDWQGLAGFRDIVPNYKAHTTLKFWGAELWGKTLVREMRSVLEFFEETFQLVRLESETADPRIVKLTKLLSFDVEGAKKKGFIWNGKYYDLYLLGRVKGE